MAYVTITIEMTEQLEEDAILETIECILDEDYDGTWHLVVTEEPLPGYKEEEEPT